LLSALLPCTALAVDESQVTAARAALGLGFSARRLDWHTALRDIAQEPHRRQQHDQAAVPVRDERQRHARERQ